MIIWNPVFFNVSNASLTPGVGSPVSGNLCSQIVPSKSMTMGVFSIISFPLFQVIPFKSPLKKGDSGGCVFSGLFYNPLAPFPKGDSLCHTSYNPLKQMKIPIQSSSQENTKL